MSSGNVALDQYCAALAPEIDRLFVAGHRAARPDSMALREQFGLRGFGPLIDLRRQLLTPHGMPQSSALVKQPTASRTEIIAALQDSVTDGLLFVREERYHPTVRGTAVLDGLGDALSRGLGRLWRSHPDLSTAIALAGPVVLNARAILVPADYPAFFVETYGAAPSDSDRPATLWTLLSDLRYARADAHAAAWRGTTQDWLPKILLTTLCHNDSSQSVDELQKEVSTRSRDDVIECLTALTRLGWVQQVGNTWQATASGAERRAAIERSTNTYMTPLFLALDTQQRQMFLTGLHQLPSE